MEDGVRSIANFFFFAFLDEGLANDHSNRVTAKFKARVRKHGNMAVADQHALIVHLTNEAYLSQRKTLMKGHTLISGDGGWVVPEGMDLAPWKQFHKEASDHEMLSVLWSQILGFPDQAISEGIGVTIGTVRYRVGHGLQKLGATHRFKNQVR